MKLDVGRYNEIRKWLAERRMREPLEPLRERVFVRDTEGIHHVSVDHGTDDTACTECGRTVACSSVVCTVSNDSLMCAQCKQFLIHNPHHREQLARFVAD